MKNKQKGSAKLLFISFIVLFFFYGGYYFYSQNNKNLSSLAVSQASKNIVGTWQRVSDSSDIIIYSNDYSFKKTQKGKFIDSGIWKISPTLIGTVYEELDNGVYLSEISSMGLTPTFFIVLDISSDTLDLSYIDQGNTISYKRIN